jgi:hypothetical protein
MKFLLCFLSLFSSLFFSQTSFAWGRHDVITEITLDNAEFSTLKTIKVPQETIDQVAPDLVARVMPALLKWCEAYHLEHDTRYAWKQPETFPATKNQLSARAKLLWDLEDNMDTELKLGPEKTAADILVNYVSEPDGLLDGGLEKTPYVERLRESMSYFGGNDANTHAFRHYYVSSSLLPPIVSPKGIAPYRAALYAKLSEGAFDTGHPYWGYRFLAWAIHYTQDVTQPWHTIFLPGPSFLSFSKNKMKKEVSALHYLTEAFADAWMEKKLMEKTMNTRTIASAKSLPVEGSSNPWFVAELTEKLGRQAHEKAEKVAELARTLFRPVVDGLNAELKPAQAEISFGGIDFASAGLDFDGDGRGATRFLSPMWKEKFTLFTARDQLLRELVTQVNAAIGGSRIVISHVLGNIHSDQLMKPGFNPTEGMVVGFPS